MAGGARLVLALLCMGLSDPVWAGSALDQWRQQLRLGRQLADNDAPRAWQLAQSLRAAAPAGATGPDRAGALNLLARSELHLAMTEAAGRDARAALDLAALHGDRVGEAEAELVLVLNSINEGNIDAMVGSATHALALLEGADRPELLGEALLRVAVMYRRLGQLEDSVALAVQAMAIARRSNHPYALAYAHQGLALSYEQSDRTDEARSHYQAMRDSARAAGSKMLEAQALAGLGATANRSGQPREALALIERSIRLFREVGMPFNINFGLFSLADSWRMQHRHAQTLPLYEEMLATYRRHPNRIATWFTLNARSAVHLEMGNPALALADAERAQLLAREVNFPLYLSESARLLARIAAARGQPRRAYALLAQAGDIVAKAARDKASARMVDLTRRYEAESKRREFEDLTRRNAQQAAELRQRALQQRWLWGLLTGSGLVLCGGAVFQWRLRRSHRLLALTNVALQSSRTEVQQQSGILQSILDSMGDGVVVAGEHGQLLLVNPAAEQLTGIMPATDWAQRQRCYHADQRTPYAPSELPLARAMRGEACDRVVVFVPRPDAQHGRWLDVTARPLIDRGGRVRGGVAVFSDVTTRRRAEEQVRDLNASLELRVQARTAELRQQRRYLRVLIDTLPWPVWFKDTGSRYLAVNHAAAQSWGRSVESMVGLSDADVAPALAEALHADDLAVMIGRRPHTEQQAQMTHRGLAWVETFKAPVLDDDGTVLGTVGFARDISEHKQVEEAREAALAEAQKLARLRSEFLAQMSHELRTPLNGILGYAQVLLRDPALDQRQRSAVGVIQQSGDHLLTLINDILDAAKIEASKLALETGAVALGHCVRSIAGIIRVKAEQKDLAFSCSIAAEVPAVVQADERRLRQALLNLLANAVKFTDRGGVSLRVELAGPGRVRFEVGDTGIGIHADQLEHIFQPFEQLGAASRRHGGTGLGLAISRQFVRLLGGEIEVESEPGQGSRFWFELALPVLDAAAPPPAPRQRRAGYAGARKRVLVVDEVAANRTLLADMLRPLGFLVAEAAHGQAALALAPALQPDLVLIDLAMPGMDALETARRLRRPPALAAPALIAISACGGECTPGLLALVDACLAKPIDLEQLLAQAGALLRLDWCYEAPLDAGDEEAERGAGLPLVAPGPAEMALLHHLARLGNMRDIMERASYLARLDPSVRPFARRLRALAEGYQSKAVLNLVAQFMEGEPE